jgi:UDP-N-acetylmuramate--alanine ligase
MIKVGIFFGGVSREREVSFAGGRTVYDNLDKSLFEAIPLFVDSWGNICLLDWQYIYKGSIRDFYPPLDAIAPSKHGFQIYAESIGNISHEVQADLLKEIGKPIKLEQLRELIDFAFLALHGQKAEDGTIQGLLEWLGIPYSGSGIIASTIGINKAVQKPLQQMAGFATPKYYTIERASWNSGLAKQKEIYKKCIETVGIPCVVKAANQGSSIGISVVDSNNFSAFEQSIDHAFFTKKITKKEWDAYTVDEKIKYIRSLADIREGLGMPVLAIDKTIHHPEDLYKLLEKHFVLNQEIVLEAVNTEHEVIVEGFISGKEFSCIVIQDEHNQPIALPPTEIVKNKEVFDYRSKYLPGLSRKVTPIDIDKKYIHEIRLQCSELFNLMRCKVYARIDGFISDDGTIYLNDPNTTSGMMPSSFFFHQAAEIGLNPSQFLTYIIRTSLDQRGKEWANNHQCIRLLKLLDHYIQKNNESAQNKIRVAVIMGGYSSERHISVESGRNIYEKLSSSSKYIPTPIFLTGNDKKFELWQIPVNMMLKDNADDIREKINHFKIHPVLEEIKNECKSITEKYAGPQAHFKPIKIKTNELSEIADRVFIALHGRPGEDGEIQKLLIKQQLPFNGSGVESSKTTINKYDTNNILRNHGFIVAESMIIKKEDWASDAKTQMTLVDTRIGFPLIAKPADDGCSSAVKKLNNNEELKAFAKAMFREKETLPADAVELLKLQPKEEFPQKDYFLIEKLIEKSNHSHFLEITGGLLTKYDKDGHIKYEMFEPSETLADGAILSLEEKFLAGEGQNITPARYNPDKKVQKHISKLVRQELKKAAKLLKVEGYARIDAFVKVYNKSDVEVNIIEVNSLPGMTPATCIFHQCALDGYKPYDFIDSILEFGTERLEKSTKNEL